MISQISELWACDMRRFKHRSFQSLGILLYLLQSLPKIMSMTMALVILLVLFGRWIKLVSTSLLLITPEDYARVVVSSVVHVRDVREMGSSTYHTQVLILRVVVLVVNAIVISPWRRFEVVVLITHFHSRRGTFHLLTYKLDVVMSIPHCR
jgi:hypothetical protein